MKFPNVAQPVNPGSLLHKDDIWRLCPPLPPMLLMMSLTVYINKDAVWQQFEQVSDLSKDIPSKL